MSETRVTKSEMFAEARDIMYDEGHNDLGDFFQDQIDSLAEKAARAKEKAAEKRAAGDEYKAIVVGALTNDLQTGQTIYSAVGDEDLTLGKVRARLTQLVKDGVVVKEEVKETIGDKTHTVMAYRLA